MADGYLKKEYKRESGLRKLAFFCLLPHTEKNRFSFQKFIQDYWPLSLDDEYIQIEKGPVEQMTKEEKRKEYERIMAIYNPKRFAKMQEAEKNKVR